MRPPLSKAVLRIALVALPALACVAFGQEGGGVELPLGALVRPGRVVVVRASGVDRVRGPTGPWAWGQGVAGDEFVVGGPRTATSTLELMLDRGGHVISTTLPVASVEADVSLVGVPPQMGPGLLDRDPEEVSFTLPASGLPTIREGWLVLDGVARLPDGASSAARTALEAWRRGPSTRPAQGDVGEPLLLPPSSPAFRATAGLESAAPHVPRPVATAVWILAALEMVLLLVTRGISSGPKRSAWLAVAPLAFVGWITVEDNLPGAVRATSVTVDGAATPWSLVVIRVDGRRAGRFEFEAPPGATTPTLIPFDAGDVTPREATCGRRVRIDLLAGETRLVVYAAARDGVRESTQRSSDGESPLDPPCPLDPEVSAWLEGWGLGSGAVRVTGSATGAPVRPSSPVIPSGAFTLRPGK